MNEIEKLKLNLSNEDKKVRLSFSILVSAFIIDLILSAQIFLIPMLYLLGLSVLLYMCLKKWYLLSKAKWIFTDSHSAYFKAKHYNMAAAFFVCLITAGFLFAVYGNAIMPLAVLSGFFFGLFYNKSYNYIKQL